MEHVELRRLRRATDPGVRATVMVSGDGWLRVPGSRLLVGLAGSTAHHPLCLRGGAGSGPGARERGGGSGGG